LHHRKIKCQSLFWEYTVITLNDIQYNTHGDCRAYIQFKQTLPPGFRQLTAWPAQEFQTLAPPQSPL
jgi:hypothetical protein